MSTTSSAAASQWIHAHSSKSLRSHVDPSLYRLLMQRHLGAPIFDSEFHCPFCDDIIARSGDLCLFWWCVRGRQDKATQSVTERSVFCNSVNLNPELERPSLVQPMPLSGSTRENSAARRFWDPSPRRRLFSNVAQRWTSRTRRRCHQRSLQRYSAEVGCRWFHCGPRL